MVYGIAYDNVTVNHIVMLDVGRVILALNTSQIRMELKRNEVPMRVQQVSRHTTHRSL